MAPLSTSEERLLSFAVADLPAANDQKRSAGTDGWQTADLPLDD